MTKPLNPNHLVIAQGALQAYSQYGGETNQSPHNGYVHDIRIYAGGGVFLVSKWLESGSIVYEEGTMVDAIGVPNSQLLNHGYQMALNNIIKIEHRRGKCVGL